jgi:hypothetical protein
MYHQKKNLTGISVFMPIGVTALCTYPVSSHATSSGASLTAAMLQKERHIIIT